jgi:hypothetical protein
MQYQFPYTHKSWWLTILIDCCCRNEICGVKFKTYVEWYQKKPSHFRYLNVRSALITILHRTHKAYGQTYNNIFDESCQQDSTWGPNVSHLHLLTYSMEQSPSWEANCLQLVKKFPAFYGTWRFLTALTSARHLSLSWASPIQSSHPLLEDPF